MDKLYHNLAVELDGSQHYLPDQVVKDAVRTGFLRANGIHVLRLSNQAVLTERGAVLAEIMRTLDRPHLNVKHSKFRRDVVGEYLRFPLPTGEG